MMNVPFLWKALAAFVFIFGALAGMNDWLGLPPVIQWVVAGGLAALSACVDYDSGLKRGRLMEPPMLDDPECGLVREKITYERLAGTPLTDLPNMGYGFYVTVRAIDGPGRGKVRTVSYKKDLPDTFHLDSAGRVVTGRAPW